MPKLFSTAYFPPVSYFAAIAQEMKGLSDRRDGDSSAILSPSVVYMEACENYQKQTYRNRCRFYAADGVQSLQLPVIHKGGTHKLPIDEVMIDYSKPWLLQHQRAIISAYRTSAYFEYYQDELFEILNSRPDKLLDLNMRLTRFFLDKTGIKADIRMTEDFSREGIIIGQDGTPVKCQDLRDIIHPKKENDILKELGVDKSYFQVFGHRFGFQKDLSIMDLLFNEGPDSILYLKTL